MKKLLQWVWIRLFYCIKVGVRLALFVPILVFMAAFSYKIDRSGLFQGALGPRTVVNLLLDGRDVTNFEQMDQRAVVKLYAQAVPAEAAPAAVGIGSSRVLQFDRRLAGMDSFFNLGVTGADVRDNMTSYYSMVKAGKTPAVLLWSVDPWIFYGSENAFDSRADSELYSEFLQTVLGVETGYEEPDAVELWTALADPAYFQGNVDYWFKSRQGAAVDDSGNEIPFHAVTAGLYESEISIKRSDGSVLYPKSFREQTQEQILYNAMTECDTFASNHMEGFTALSPVQTTAFDAFIRYAQGQGTTVILILAPWHPYLYDYLLWQEDSYQGFFKVEAWVRAYAKETGIPLYGSYDPLPLGMEEMDFFDGLHCKGVGFTRFFPGIPAVLEAIQNRTLPDPAAITARTTNEERVPW